MARLVGSAKAANAALSLYISNILYKQVLIVKVFFWGGALGKL